MSATDKLQYYLSQIDKELSKFPRLNNLERQTGVPKTYGVLGFGGLFALLIFFNVAASFLSNLVGVIVPAYFSLRALETPAAQDDVQWLTYWTVFGFFQLIEGFVSVVLYYFPFYYSFKVAVIVWLMLPQTRGAVTVYQKVLRPLVAQSGSATPHTAPTAHQ